MSAQPGANARRLLSRGGAERAFVALRLRGLSNPFLVRGMARAMGLRTIPEPAPVRYAAWATRALQALCTGSPPSRGTAQRTKQSFFCPKEAEHLAMTAPGSPWVAVLFRTDSWATVAHTKLVSVPRFAPVAAPTLAPVPAAPLLGRCVRLVGLVGRPELNGDIAHICSFVRSAILSIYGKTRQRCCNGGGAVLVREANLVEASNINEQD